MVGIFDRDMTALDVLIRVYKEVFKTQLERYFQTLEFADYGWNINFSDGVLTLDTSAAHGRISNSVYGRLYGCDSIDSTRHIIQFTSVDLCITLSAHTEPPTLSCLKKMLLAFCGTDCASRMDTPGFFFSLAEGGVKSPVLPLLDSFRNINTSYQTRTINALSFKDLGGCCQ